MPLSTLKDHIEVSGSPLCRFGIALLSASLRFITALLWVFVVLGDLSVV
jgi:hypothetical protein